MYWESVFYIMVRWRFLSVVFHVFYLNLMPFSMPGKLQKGLFFSPVSPNFGRVTRPQPPISLPSTPQNSTFAPLFRCPEPRFSYPKPSFGMSHFTFWGILRRVYAPIFAPFYPLFALISSHFRGKNGRQNVCLSPQLSGNQTTRSLLQCPHAG